MMAACEVDGLENLLLRRRANSVGLGGKCEACRFGGKWTRRASLPVRVPMRDWGRQELCVVRCDYGVRPLDWDANSHM